MKRPHFQLLSRKDCCLCEDAKAIIESFADQGRCTWDIVDVDGDKALLVRYGLDVPVLLANGKEIGRHHISAATLEGFLGKRMVAAGGRA